MTLRAFGLALALSAFADDPPLSPEEVARLNGDLEQRIHRAAERIKADPKEVEGYSRRGDALFMRGRFKESVADYEKMVELDPKLDAGHWRRGIAFFYAGDYAKAARQFEIYHTHDDVDRENGIWRFFSQAKAHGLDKAREGLLKYAKDDREPFPAVYKLFEKKITPEEILKQIEAAKIDDEARESRLFYAHLYIGLNATVENRTEEAVKHLRQAVANPWGPKAGFGPSYMWHVGRLHYDLLTAEKK
jgi:lipoprotein NlpI